MCLERPLNAHSGLCCHLAQYISLLYAAVRVAARTSVNAKSSPTQQRWARRARPPMS